MQEKGVVCMRSKLLCQDRLNDVRVESRLVGCIHGARTPGTIPSGGWLRPANVDSSQFRRSICSQGMTRFGENRFQCRRLSSDDKWRQDRNQAAPYDDGHESTWMRWTQHGSCQTTHVYLVSTTTGGASAKSGGQGPVPLHLHSSAQQRDCITSC